jgi:hypothetical protein
MEYYAFPALEKRRFKRRERSGKIEREDFLSFRRPTL